MLSANGIEPQAITDDLYASDVASQVPDIRTFYEQQWLDRGLSIKYIRFPLPAAPALVEPEVEIEPDTYRSFGRGELQGF